MFCFLCEYTFKNRLNIVCLSVVFYAEFLALKTFPSQSRFRRGTITCFAGVGPCLGVSCVAGTASAPCVCPRGTCPRTALSGGPSLGHSYRSHDRKTEGSRPGAGKRARYRGHARPNGRAPLLPRLTARFLPLVPTAPTDDGTPTNSHATHQFLEQKQKNLGGPGLGTAGANARAGRPLGT